MKIEEIKMDVADLKSAKNRLVQEKMALQSETAEINAKCRVTLPMREFQKLQSHRGQLVGQINNIEIEISKLNSQITEANTVVSVKTGTKDIQRNTINGFVELRDSYHEKSMNPDHSPELRRTFWKFSQEIRGILNPYWEMMKGAE